MSTIQQELREVRVLDGAPEQHIKGLVDHSMMRAVYVYEAPVRLWHWVTVLAMIGLVGSGFLIGRPLPSVEGEASTWYVMGYVRLVHFICAYVFAIGFVGRLYWHFVGNEWAKQLFVPAFHKASYWRGLVDQVMWYLFLSNKPRQYVGHNPLANTAMFLMFTLMGLWMIVSGFALYAEGLGRDSWAAAMFGWVTIFFPNSMDLHTWHRFGMWVMVLFSIIHMYMAFREDNLSKQGTISTIVGGYRYFKD